jgi:predicted NBD/HSP70 family sugar kinase
MKDLSPPQTRGEAPRPGTRGTNQSGMRAHNERLVLTLLRRNGPLPKAEIARLSGLSAQTVSVIMRALEADGLIARGAPMRGKVGQPSIPMRLVGDSAFFFGLKVGRRSMELVLVDFLGTVQARAREVHAWPTPDGALAFLRGALPALTAGLPDAARERIGGLGIGLPFHLWDWAGALGVPPAALEPWRTADLRGAIAAELDFPVFLENDASAACNAEIVFANRSGPEGVRDFLYAYVGYFAGGGLVLNGSLVTGRTGNAGALGSVPVPAPGGGSVQLLQVASLQRLEAMLRARGDDPAAMWDDWQDWRIDPGCLSAWIEGAAAGLAHAAAAAAALVDLEALVVDGWMPPAVRARLVRAIGTALGRIDRAGIAPIAVLEGAIGGDARALGAASIPLAMRYLVDPNALMTPA